MEWDGWEEDGGIAVVEQERCSCYHGLINTNPKGRPVCERVRGHVCSAAPPSAVSTHVFEMISMQSPFVSTVKQKILFININCLQQRV